MGDEEGTGSGGGGSAHKTAPKQPGPVKRAAGAVVQAVGRWTKKSHKGSSVPVPLAQQKQVAEAYDLFISLNAKKIGDLFYFGGAVRPSDIAKLQPFERGWPALEIDINKYETWLETKKAEIGGEKSALWKILQYDLSREPKKKPETFSQVSVEWILKYLAEKNEGRTHWKFIEGTLGEMREVAKRQGKDPVQIETRVLDTLIARNVISQAVLENRMLIYFKGIITQLSNLSKRVYGDEPKYLSDRIVFEKKLNACKIAEELDTVLSEELAKLEQYGAEKSKHLVDAAVKIEKEIDAIRDKSGGKTPEIADLKTGKFSDSWMQGLADAVYGKDPPKTEGEATKFGNEMKSAKNPAELLNIIELRSGTPIKHPRLESARGAIDFLKNSDPHTYYGVMASVEKRPEMYTQQFVNYWEKLHAIKESNPTTVREWMASKWRAGAESAGIITAKAWKNKGWATLIGVGAGVGYAALWHHPWSEHASDLAERDVYGLDIPFNAGSHYYTIATEQLASMKGTSSWYSFEINTKSSWGAPFREDLLTLWKDIQDGISDLDSTDVERERYVRLKTVFEFELAERGFRIVPETKEIVPISAAEKKAHDKRRAAEEQIIRDLVQWHSQEAGPIPFELKERICTILITNGYFGFTVDGIDEIIANEKTKPPRKVTEPQLVHASTAEVDSSGDSQKKNTNEQSQAMKEIDSAKKQVLTDLNIIDKDSLAEARFLLENLIKGQRGSKDLPQIESITTITTEVFAPFKEFWRNFGRHIAVSDESLPAIAQLFLYYKGTFGLKEAGDKPAREQLEKTASIIGYIVSVMREEMTEVTGGNPARLGEKVFLPYVAFTKGKNFEGVTITSVADEFFSSLEGKGSVPIQTQEKVAPTGTMTPDDAEFALGTARGLSGGLKVAEARRVLGEAETQLKLGNYEEAFTLASDVPNIIDRRKEEALGAILETKIKLSTAKDQRIISGDLSLAVAEKLLNSGDFDGAFEDAQKVSTIISDSLLKEEMLKILFIPNTLTVKDRQSRLLTFNSLGAKYSFEGFSAKELESLASAMNEVYSHHSTDLSFNSYSSGSEALKDVFAYLAGNDRSGKENNGFLLGTSIKEVEDKYGEYHDQFHNFVKKK